MQLNQPSVIGEAGDVVDRTLNVVEALAEAHMYRIREGSVVCPCARCATTAENTLAWVEGMRSQAPSVRLVNSASVRQAARIGRRIFQDR